MAPRHGPRSSNITGRIAVALIALALAACRQVEPDRVVAARYDSFWLWAGVAPPKALGKARSVYLLDSEIRGQPARFIPLRPGIPATSGPAMWMVVRTNTLAWPKDANAALVARLNRWTRAGNRVDGIQIDFDAATRGLGAYADFLAGLRRDLPARYRLSITGLMDWSANGDPRHLDRLKGTVDEVVVQTYQGRSTIPGYDRYFDRMKGFPIPFKVGLVEDGLWTPPPRLASEPNFRGYVVFLVNKG